MGTDPALRALAADPPAAAILLDVDGTLAPVVARPEDAAVPDETRAELRRLDGAYELVACISGRPADDARRVVGVPGLVYVGEHGLELDPDAPAWGERLRTFARGVDWPAERNRLSLSFHFRRADDEEAAKAYLTVVAEQASAAGLVPRWGRKVLEVRPPLPTHKGTAVRRVLADHGLRRALYAGDDETDLDAFAALAGLDVAVRVAVVSPEAPDSLRGAADLSVDGPAGLLELLREL